MFKTSCISLMALAVAASAQERNPHPYQGIDWAKVHQVKTSSHVHITDQAKLDRFIAKGFTFFTLSNYYPSAPYYPMSRMTLNYYRVHHEHPVMVNGVLTKGPFDWNEILKPWIAEVDAQYSKSYPFKEGGKAFTNIPDNIMEAPNAEHHSFTDCNAHITAPGSFYKSGTFDARNFFLTKSKGGYNYGTGLPWRKAVDNMLAELQYPDGGGVVLNHPQWSSFKRDTMLEILDHDPRLLGIEVFNHTSRTKVGDAINWSEDYWDYALGTGRQCFGFFVHDWSSTNGVNILIVPELNAHECLKAYRQGNWYGAVYGQNQLGFTLISFDGATLKANTDKTAKFQVVSKEGIIHESTTASLELPIAKADYAKHGFLRIKAFATDDSGEIIFSQPFMLK